MQKAWNYCQEGASTEFNAESIFGAALASFIERRNKLLLNVEIMREYTASLAKCKIEMMDGVLTLEHFNELNNQLEQAELDLKKSEEELKQLLECE